MFYVVNILTQQYVSVWLKQVLYDALIDDSDDKV